MNELLDVPNPDEKIKEVLKQAIKNRENRIKKINSQIDSIKKQDADGNIFVPFIIANLNSPFLLLITITSSL